MVRHIPPTIKQLLTLRSPDAFAGRSTSRLNCLFKKTYADARLKGAGTAWLVLTTCTLLTANTPSSVGHLYRFVTRSGKENDVQSSVRNAALMREAALKSTIFVGVPRTIGALAGLTDALEDDVKAGLRTNSRSECGGTHSCSAFPEPPPRKTSTPSLLAGPRSGTPYTSRTPSSCTTNSRLITLTSSRSSSSPMAPCCHRFPERTSKATSVVRWDPS